MNILDKRNFKKMNRLQVHIFKKLSSESDMEIEDYLISFSKENINRSISTLEELTEEEADSWITKLYLKSLG